MMEFIKDISVDVGVLIVVVYFAQQLLEYTIKRASNDINDIRTLVTKEFDTIHKSFEVTTRSLNRTSLLVIEMMNILIHHDARVRGINPDVGSTPEERLTEAERAYKEILRTIKRTSDFIEKEL